MLGRSTSSIDVMTQSLAQESGIEIAKNALSAYITKYVERYKGVRGFHDVPILTKADLARNFGAHISDEIPSVRSNLINTLNRPDLLVGRSDEIYCSGGIVIEQTSGTSGIILLVPKTKAERLRSSLAIYNYRRRFDREFRQAAFYPLVHPSKGLERPFSPGLLTKENISNLYKFLCDRSIRWIHVNPRLLRAHLGLVDDKLISNSQLRFIENTGFSLDDGLRLDVERRWNVSIVDQYGCREVWVIGVRNSDGPFSILEQNVIVELLDADGISITSSGQEGRIIVSSIHQRLFPIVRYDTGDLGFWEFRDGQKKLKLSSTRSHSYLFINNKRSNGVEIFKEILYGVYRFLNIHSVRYIQIQQVAEFEFKILTSGFCSVDIFVKEVGRRFNAIHREDRDFVFRGVELSQSETDIACEGKPVLFIRKIV